MENKDTLYELLIENLKTYMPLDDINNIDKYYQKALKIYDGMRRLTGEEYICHALRVAIILTELKMDAISIGCALIHEAITLEKMTYEEVSEEFGEEEATILNSISKLTHLKRTFKNRGDDKDKYRRIVVGLSENPISLFIKLADRLDNLRYQAPLNPEHTKEVCEETELIYIPIAHRLGIKSMKSELEDLCLRYTDPVGYKEVLDKINASNEELSNSLYKMRDELIKLLNEHDIKFDISYRVKSVRGIYNKLKKGRKWSEIFDLLGLRILVEKDEECYLVVGLIHSKFRPIPKRFKDYIANPKNNMYQSLHTTVFGVDSQIFEVQIRTYEMNEIAEHGVASHWSYKEHTDGSKQGELENKLALFRTVIEVNDIEGNNDFFNDLKNNITNDFIYIFTPKGDIIELPTDSTPVDFAYKIHSEIGNTLTGALVNGKMVSLDYVLSDGDIVDLKTTKGHIPSKEWLSFVKTDGAKSRIKSFFYKKEREKSIETGKEIINAEIKKSKYNASDLLAEEIIEKFIEDMKVDNFDEIAIGVSTYKFAPSLIVEKLINIFDPKEEDLVEKYLGAAKRVKTTSSAPILIAGYSDILTQIASCCTPVMGEDIVGYITKGSGVTIHRKGCPRLEGKEERIIDAKWNYGSEDRFTTKLKITIDSTNENLVDIITAATKWDTLVSSIDNVGRTHNEDIYSITCKVKDKEALYRFMQDLENLKFVSKVER